MTKDEKKWLTGGTIGTILIMVFFVWLMSDLSPLHHEATSNTQALIDSLGTWQSRRDDASGEALMVGDEIVELAPTEPSIGEQPTSEIVIEEPVEETTTLPSPSAATLRASDIDWENVDLETLDFGALELDGADVFTSDQVIQLLQNNEEADE